MANPNSSDYSIEALERRLDTKKKELADIQKAIKKADSDVAKVWVDRRATKMFTAYARSHQLAVIASQQGIDLIKALDFARAEIAAFVGIGTDAEYIGGLVKDMQIHAERAAKISNSKAYPLERIPKDSKEGVELVSSIPGQFNKQDIQKLAQTTADQLLELTVDQSVVPDENAGLPEHLPEHDASAYAASISASPPDVNAGLTPEPDDDAGLVGHPLKATTQTQSPMTPQAEQVRPTFRLSATPGSNSGAAKTKKDRKRSGAPEIVQERAAKRARPSIDGVEPPSDEEEHDTTPVEPLPSGLEHGTPDPGLAHQFPDKDGPEDPFDPYWTKKFEQDMAQFIPPENDGSSSAVNPGGAILSSSGNALVDNGTSGQSSLGEGDGEEGDDEGLLSEEESDNKIGNDAFGEDE